MNFIDLFAGAGGLSEGFIRAGFTPLAHIEIDINACNTLKTRSSHHYLKSIDKLDVYIEYLQNKNEKEDGRKLWKHIPSSVINTVIQSEISRDTINDLFSRIDALIGYKQVDIIIGGPPCQAYSMVGRARIGKAVEEDPRNDLYKFYVNFLERYKPKMFVFENVMGIYTAKNGEPFRHFTGLVEKAGYTFEHRVETASDYEVLQKRQRVFFVGWRTKEKSGKINNLHYPNLDKEENDYEVLKDLFMDLPQRKNGEGFLCKPVEYIKPLSEMTYLENSKIRSNYINFTMQHVARPNNENDRNIYKIAIDKWLKKKLRLSYLEIPEKLQTHNNKKSFLNRYQVVDPYGHCHTVVAHIAMDGHYYIYPTMRPTVENVRSITVREAARIQSFPDDYYFEGSRTSAFKQIGNAVPVVLAEKIARKIGEMITQ